MITETDVSSYDDTLVCSKHISGPWGMQGPFGLKWSLNEPIFWVQWPREGWREEGWEGIRERACREGERGVGWECMKRKLLP